MKSWDVAKRGVRHVGEKGRSDLAGSHALGVGDSGRSVEKKVEDPTCLPRAIWRSDQRYVDHSHGTSVSPC